VAAVTEHFVLRALVVAAGQACRAPSAAHTRLQHDPTADVNLDANRRDDFPGDVAARDVRHRELHAIETAPLPQIQVIQRTRAHPHERVADIELRIRRFFAAENLRPAVSMEANGFHGIARGSAPPG
jgi:hypothetical protein